MKFFYLSLIILFLYGKAFTQVNYTFSAFSGTYVSITGGTTPVLLASEALPTHDEGYANGLPIGFTFKYNGVNYTTINANSNGFATFNNFVPVTSSATQDYYTPDLAFGPFGLTSVRPLLAPLWDDLDLFSAADLKYITTGTTPNRVFTLQWSNVYWDISAANLNIEFQLKLYETSNLIEFNYHQLAGVLSGTATAAIGITATGTGNGNFLSLSNSSASPTASSTVNTFNINTKPAEGQIYRFTPNAPLPIIIESFTGERKDKINTLHWVTSFEQNNKSFELQRSGDGVNFIKLESIQSKAPGGNSTLTLHYSFDDTKPLSGGNFYRLKQFDLDDKATYSLIVSLHAPSSIAARFISLYPNPITNSVNLILYASEKITTTLFITDVSGKVVLQKNMQVNAGDNYVSLDVNNFSKGTYAIKVVTQKGEITVTKFVK